MGYFFGKDINADPSALLTGAYNFSLNGSNTAPINAPQTSQVSSNASTDNKSNVIGCINGCDAKYDIATQYNEWKACVDNCKGGGGGTGGETGGGTGGGTGAQCPEGTGAAYDGCGCGTEYYTKTGNCPAGYGFIKKDDKPGYVGKCYCQKWVNETDPAVTGKGGTLGDYEYPSQISDLMNMLLGRSKELLGTAPGYSQEAIDAMFGRNFENVRTAEAGTRNTLLNTLGSQGMLGTGTALGALNKNAWNTEDTIANLGRDIMIANEDKKKEDLMNLSTAAQSLFGTGLNYEQLLEAINASRRGESSSALAMLLALFQSMMSSASA